MEKSRSRAACLRLNAWRSDHTNHEVPAPGDVVDAKYLYAFRESGSVYQPVYLGKRDDIPATECSVEQLKYKPEPAS